LYKHSTEMGAPSLDDPLLEGLLSSSPPKLSSNEAIAFLATRYGINAQVREVACERDQNFHVRSNDGQEYVLKITNPEEPALTTDFQTEGMLWISRKDPSLPVPRLVPTSTGEVQTKLSLKDGRECSVRVLTWLQGESLHKVAITPEITTALGAMLARLGLALEKFDHPGAREELLWDIRHTSRLRPLLSALQDDEIGAAVRAELDRYETHTLPKLSSLRRQVVHNDLNHHNVIVNPANHSQITGLIDFGDMVETCLVVDVAVAASYLADAEDPLTSVSQFIGAYHGVKPLLPAEIAILRDLIIARLITSISITEWRAFRYPENADYILRNNGPARRALLGFGSLDSGQVTETLLGACKLE
jgi:hydroxylysine kinase